MDREVIVKLSALNEVVQYLSHRPYRDVVDLISNLTHSIREIPDEKETKEEDTNSVPETRAEP